MVSLEAVPVIKILVIDDDPSVCNLIGRFLREEGYDPVICTHPWEALDYMKKNPADLAFVDINMPEMNGLELAAELKKDNPTCEIVFITGFGTFDNAIQAIKVGAYDYLRKPFGISELNLCVKRFQERMELKDQVSRAELRYFNLVQNIPCLVFIAHSDFSLDFINRACEPMLGYSVDEAINDPGWLIKRIHPDDLQRIKEAFSRAFNLQSLRFSEGCRLIHRDGHLIHAMVGSIVSPKIYHGNVRETLQGVIVDITDRVFLEREVIQREKLKLLGSISAEVAHGIRNPLVSIGGFARRLRKRFEDLPEGDIILEESKRLENILQRIAEYLKPVEVNYEECSINELISVCVNQIISEGEDGGPNIRLELEGALSPAKIDKEIMGGLFINLIKNAEKNMDKDGNLIIKTFESGNHYHIEFICDVRNVKIKDPDPFFLPFNSSEKEIGLPLSYRLLKNMGGILSYSQGDRDMVFTVSMPKTPVISTDKDGVLLR